MSANQSEASGFQPLAALTLNWFKKWEFSPPGMSPFFSNLVGPVTLTCRHAEFMLRLLRHPIKLGGLGFFYPITLKLKLKETNQVI